MPDPSLSHSETSGQPTFDWVENSSPNRLNAAGPEQITVTFATVKEAQAAFLACERLRVSGRWPTGWARAGEEAELTIHYALKERDAHDF